jgi:transcriptional regulator with XRE-family HTH domain
MSIAFARIAPLQSNISCVTITQMEEDAVLTINQRVKRLRKALGLTQKDFSGNISLSTAQIACIETEKRTVNDRTIKLLCNAFYVSEQWLKTGEGEMFSRQSDAKFTRLNGLFADLQPKYQDFILNAIEQFLKLQDKERMC